MPKKIVQIAAYTLGNHAYLIALCDDGSLYRRLTGSTLSQKNVAWRWSEIETIPTAAEIEPGDPLA